MILNNAPTDAPIDANNTIFVKNNIWVSWLGSLVNIINANSSGLGVVVTTAQLTANGTQGSMTFVNGVLTKQTQAT